MNVLITFCIKQTHLPSTFSVMLFDLRKSKKYLMHNLLLNVRIHQLLIVVQYSVISGTFQNGNGMKYNNVLQLESEINAFICPVYLRSFGIDDEIGGRN